MVLDVKLVCSIVSCVVALFGFYHYIRDIFLRKTEPHIYTWLIWLITAGIATAGVYVGNGGYALINMSIGTACVGLIVILSFFYGSKNITKSDTAVLCVALFAIVVWWYFEQPLLAVLLATIIDIAGYIPTYRKAFQEPYTETVSSWVLFTIAPLFALGALTEYNALTTTYLSAVAAANLLVVLLCSTRRRTMKLS